MNVTCGGGTWKRPEGQGWELGKGLGVDVDTPYKAADVINWPQDAPVWCICAVHDVEDPTLGLSSFITG
jgi:hypothetical protein